MKRRLIASLVIAMMLVTALAVPAMAVEPEETEVGASVTVSEYISFTVTDPDPTGLQFGSPDPGDVDNPEAAQTETTGAVTLTVEDETNVACNINVKATDFTYSTYTIAITNAKYGTTNVLGNATAFVAADTYYLLGTSTITTETTVNVWHWLSIPSIQAAGTYTSTFTYQAVAQ